MGLGVLVTLLKWKVDFLLCFIDFSRQSFTLIHFFKKFKMIHNKITCLNRIFERKFNLWYFYELFWLTKIVRFQILLKNIKFEILFLEMLTLTHIFVRDFISLNTYNYGWPKFLRLISTWVVFTDVGRCLFGHNFFVWC